LDLNYLFPDEQIDVPHKNEESQPETGSQDFGIVVDNNVGDLWKTENLTDLEAEIAKIKETSPASTPNPEAEKKENSLQKHRRIKKEREEVEKERTKFLIADNTRLEATIAVLEQELGVPQSQTSSAPPTRCVTVSESNTQAQPGKIQRTSVIPREAPYTVPTKFQCDQCDFSSPSPHGLKIHTGKAHKLHTVALPLPCTTSVVYDLIPVNTSNDEVISYVLQPQPSSTLPSQNAPAAPTLAKSANAIRCDRHRKNNKIKKQNAVEKLKSLEEKNIKLKAKEDQLRIMVEQRRML